MKNYGFTPLEIMNNNIKNLKKIIWARNQKFLTGFTLLETLVAVTILALVVIGPLTLAVKSISAAMISQNQIIAFYLSQEAMEYIGNIRDSNFLQGKNWLDGLADCAGASGCYVDIPNNKITACAGGCPKIKYDGYYYNYASGEETIFTRTVRITPNIGGNPDEIEVDVVAQWSERFGIQKSFIVQKNFFRWK
jgi:type II secretory pathway pseudopilin PulG